MAHSFLLHILQVLPCNEQKWQYLYFRGLPKELLMDLRDSFNILPKSHHYIKPRRCGNDDENEVKATNDAAVPIFLLCVPFQHQPDFRIFPPPNNLHTHFSFRVNI